MPNFREFGRSLIGLVTGVSFVYQAEVVSAQESKPQLESNAKSAVSVLGKVTKLFSVGKDARDALELRDAKLSGQATKEQIDRGVSAMSNLGTEASVAVAVASGGRLFSITNAAVAPVLNSIVESEREILSRLIQAQEGIIRANPLNSDEMASAFKKLESVQIEAARFEPDTGSFLDSAKAMISALSGGAKDASLIVLMNTIKQIGGMVSNFADEETKTSSASSLTGGRAKDVPKSEGSLSGPASPLQNLDARSDSALSLATPDGTDQAETNPNTDGLNKEEKIIKDKNLSYEWDKKEGKYVWKVDGKIVDETSEEVQKFCASASANCPQPSTQSEPSHPTEDTAPTTASNKPDQDLPRENDKSTISMTSDSNAIGGIQSSGGNPVVQPGNSIWHGQGGFQGEEYDNNGLNGQSNIVQFKLGDWDFTDLAPSEKSSSKSTSSTQRVIDNSIPQGSAYGKQPLQATESQSGSAGEFKSTQDPNSVRRTATPGRNNNSRSRQTANGAMDPVLQGFVQGALNGVVQGLIGGAASGGARGHGASQPVMRRGCDPRAPQYNTPFPVSGGGC